MITQFECVIRCQWRFAISYVLQQNSKKLSSRKINMAKSFDRSLKLEYKVFQELDKGILQKVLAEKYSIQKNQ